tara:strand:- start:12 stop:299 length:288 start_codon:yes stop_codon:yes gene_type:complete
LAILHGITVNYFGTIKTGGNGANLNTLTGAVTTTGNDITNALDENVNQFTIVRVGTINDAENTVSAAEGLRAENVKSGGNAANLCVFIGNPTATP